MTTKKPELNCNVFVGDQVLLAGNTVPLKFTRWQVTKVGLKNKHGYPLDFQARSFKTKKLRRFDPFSWWTKVLVPDAEVDPELLKQLKENPHLVLVRHIANAVYCSHELFDLSTWSHVRLRRREISTAEFTISQNWVHVKDDDLEDSQSDYTSTVSVGLLKWLQDHASN